MQILGQLFEPLYMNFFHSQPSRWGNNHGEISSKDQVQFRFEPVLQSDQPPEPEPEPDQ